MLLKLKNIKIFLNFDLLPMKHIFLKGSLFVLDPFTLFYFLDLMLRYFNYLHLYNDFRSVIFLVCSEISFHNSRQTWQMMIADKNALKPIL